MKSPLFLSKEVILKLHKNCISKYGGIHGVRDEGLLESAISQPRATFDSKFLHKSLIEMSAAYGFHLIKNHPFLDGNKRMCLLSMDAFLQINGKEIICGEKEAYQVVMALAVSKLSKEDLSKWLKKVSREL